MSDWAVCLPFVLYAFRALVPLGLAGVARNHPHREILLVLLLLLGLASDLVDGVLARALRITGWSSVYWGDHGADLAFFFGSVVVIGGRLSWQKNLPVHRALDRSPAERRLERWVRVAWLALGVGLAGYIYFLIFERMFREM